jgi:hypothetical protein
MSALQLSTFVGIPLVVLIVALALLAFARPDRDHGNGVYASYLALIRVFSLYIGLVAAAGLGEAVSQRLVLGEGGTTEDRFSSSLPSVYISFVNDGDGAAIAAFATVLTLMVVAFAYHHRRARELATEGDAAARRVERAYSGALCFAMVAIIVSAGLIAGTSGYNFFAEPITSDEHLRDLSMGALLVYGALVLVAGLVFRANFWAIRGDDETADAAPRLADPDDA